MTQLVIQAEIQPWLTEVSSSMDLISPYSPPLVTIQIQSGQKSALRFATTKTFSVQCSGQFVHWQECPLVVYLPCFRDCGGLLCSAWHLCQPGFGHCRTGWASGKAKYWVKGGGLDIVNGFFCAVVISVLTILCI